MGELYGIAFGWILGVWSYAIYKAWPRQNTKTPSASPNSSSLPRCFYSVGSSCTAKSVQSCNRDFDSCEYRSSH